MHNKTPGLLDQEVSAVWGLQDLQPWTKPLLLQEGLDTAQAPPLVPMAIFANNWPCSCHHHPLQAFPTTWAANAPCVHPLTLYSHMRHLKTTLHPGISFLGHFLASLCTPTAFSRGCVPSRLIFLLPRTCLHTRWDKGTPSLAAQPAGQRLQPPAPGAQPQHWQGNGDAAWQPCNAFSQSSAPGIPSMGTAQSLAPAGAGVPWQRQSQKKS